MHLGPRNKYGVEKKKGHVLWPSAFSFISIYGLEMGEWLAKNKVYYKDNRRKQRLFFLRVNIVKF